MHITGTLKILWFGALVLSVRADDGDFEDQLLDMLSEPADVVKPHIIVIFADDMGNDDIGYNNPDVSTESLDELASDGIILENNYVQPICTPSRTAFLTGKYPYKTGTQHGDLTNWTPHCAPTNVPFLSETLSEAGYQTHLAGKWHLGSCKWDCTPTRRGFDSATGPLGGMVDHITHMDMDGYDWRSNEETDISAKDEYDTGLILNRTLSVIDAYEEGDDPLFMWVTFTTPQVPLQATEEFTEMVDEGVEGLRLDYLGMIAEMDDAVYNIVEGLMDAGMFENTLIIFSSDNGGEAGGFASNYPLRGGKGSLWEGATRVPGFVAGGIIEEGGTRNKGLIHIVDWAPTILSLAGVEFDASDFDGVDQTEMIINGGDSMRNEFVYNIDVEDTGAFNFGNAALRKGDMKLIWGFPGLNDGWEKDVLPFHQRANYLQILGKSADDYTDIPDERPYPYWLSPQEKEAQQSIVNMIGISGITEEEMAGGRGIALLYNLTDDPSEKTNLAYSKTFESTVEEMKKEIMERIADGYETPPARVAEMWTEQSDPVENEDAAWTPGWCEDLSMTLPFASGN